MKLLCKIQLYLLSVFCWYNVSYSQTNNPIYEGGNSSSVSLFCISPTNSLITNSTNIFSGDVNTGYSSVCIINSLTINLNTPNIFIGGDDFGYFVNCLAPSSNNILSNSPIFNGGSSLDIYNFCINYSILTQFNTSSIFQGGQDNSTFNCIAASQTNPTSPPIGPQLSIFEGGTENNNIIKECISQSIYYTINNSIFEGGNFNDNYFFCLMAVPPQINSSNLFNGGNETAFYSQCIPSSNSEVFNTFTIFEGGSENQTIKDCYNFTLNLVTNSSVIFNGGNINENFINCFIYQTPLPVNLKELSVECLDRKSIIKWTTASEYNNDYFEIEKSNDAVHYNSIGKVNSKGNSNSDTDYSFEDNEFESTAYYRLKQFDFDGTESVLNTISSNCFNTANAYIYPNPSDKITNLIIEADKNEVVTVNIYNIENRLIKTEKIEVIDGVNNIKLMLHNSTSGIYIIQVIQNDKNSTIKWLIN